MTVKGKLIYHGMVAGTLTSDDNSLNKYFFPQWLFLLYI